MPSFIQPFAREIIRKSSSGRIYSDSQVEDLLNYFLFQSIEPIIQTLWFKNELSLILSYSIRDFREKVTSKEKEEASSDIFDLIFCFNKDENIVKLRLANFDRYYLQSIAFKFIELGKTLIEYDTRFNKSYIKGNIDLEASQKISDIIDYFQGLSIDFITKSYKRVSYWMKLYLQLKERILSRYYLLAYKYALTIGFRRQNVDTECLFKSFLVSMDTALNKYTCEKGALSSYIQLWFKSTLVRPAYDFEIGKPYNIPNYAKKYIQNPAILQTIDIDSEEFGFMESKLTEQIEDKIEFIDKDFLKFLDSIKDSYIDLVKIILGLPKLSEENDSNIVNK